MTLAEYCKAQFHDPQRQWLIAKLIAGAEKHELPPALVLAVASRETNIHNREGDHGHGNGPMQLDDRSHRIPEGWEQDPTEIIDQCCLLLRNYIDWAERTFRASDVSAIQIGVAAYNCGPAGAARGLTHKNVDYYTAQGNYSADVLAREAVFVKLLEEKAG